MGATVLKLGSWNTITDTMVAHPSCPTGAVLDLNDGQTWTLNDVGQGWGEGLDWGVARPDVYKAGNVRTVGQRVTRRNYGQNRQVRVNLFLGQLSSYSAYMTALHNLVATLEGISQTQPATLQVQVTGASSPVYLDCVEGHLVTQYRELQLLQLLDDGVVVEFEARPFFRGPRQTLQNLAMNPGFEAPCGAGAAQNNPQAFSDAFANTNAYSVVAGGAPSINPANTYVDIVQANIPASGAIQIYARLDESSGTVAYDISGNGLNGTTHGSPTHGVAGLISGDTDTCYTFANASSQYVSFPNILLPTGNNPWSIAIWFKFAANPGSALALASMGGTASKAGCNVYVDTSGKLNCDLNSGTGLITSGSAAATGAAHLACATWDGTTLRLYLDGASVGTPTTPGTLAFVAGACNVGAGTGNGTTWTGQLDEGVFYSGALSATQVSNLYTAGHTGATGTVSNTMSIPAGGQVKFGSPVWGAMYTWSIAFRWVTGLSAYFYVHYTDANNYLRVWLNATTLNVEQCVGGVTHTLATAVTIALTYEAWYPLQITQFPGAVGAGFPVVVQAQLGSPRTSWSISGTTFDAATALTGQPQVAASGAALAVGNGDTVITPGFGVALFGPGAWSFASSGTGVASGAWDGNAAAAPTSANTNPYQGGPVTSYGCARIDAAPVGTLNAQWQSATTLSAIDVENSGIPVVAGNTLGISTWVKSSGVGAGCAQSIQVNEYDATGNFLRSGSVAGASVTGAQSSWIQLSGTYVVGASCNFIVLLLSAVDATSGSANGTIWWDNTLVYNQTTTGQTSMPYCELRFPQSPAQLVASGILGDVPAPVTTMAIGCYINAFFNPDTAVLRIGRRARASAGIQMVGSTLPGSGPALNIQSYGGFTTLANPGPLTFSSSLDYLTCHVYARAQTGNAAPTSVYLQPDIVEGVNGVDTGRFRGASVYPFSAQNALTVVDIGQAQIPPYPVLAQTSSNLVRGTASTFSGSTGNGNGSQLTADFICLLPVDGDIAVFALSNPASGTSPIWLYVYVDSITPAVGKSVERSAIANVAAANGMAYNQSYAAANEIGASSVTEVVLRLDPSLSTVSGTNVTYRGVNQWVALAHENNFAVPWGVAVDITYSPLYLYPN